MDLRKYEIEETARNKRTGIVIFLVSIAILMLMTAVTCQGQVYKATDISMILNRTDSISRLELLTAKKFHKKLNEYRAQKGVGKLRWSDTLYVMAMNHNAWMVQNKTLLMHEEYKNSYNFTGVTYRDRLDYVLDTKTVGTLENITWFGVIKGSMDEIADIAALTAINAWKDDKPHDDVMIRIGNKVHGVHFSYKGGYCTSEFYGTLLVKNY